MDSFFGLFDPSDGNANKNHKKKHKPDQDNVKKKTEPGKGRRRGRRSAGKHETLPEESSFLCEPNLSTELLVKDCSYVENYIEINNKEDEKMEDKKPKRRNSARKSRRRKNKTPPKDYENAEPNLNNQNLSIYKPGDENIGKNVNKLKDEENNKKSDEVSKSVNNFIDKMERCNIGDGILNGDDDFENDFYGSDDDIPEFGDDSASDAEDSSEEVYGRLPPEPRFGNVEYKLQLVPLCEKRFQHLVTQLKWRLASGGGACVYVVGVRDCGAVVGLSARALRGSLRALRRMAASLRATPHRLAVRRLAPHRALAEVHIRKLADPHQSVELRVAVMGANEAGKSTLVGVLTQGELDNGRGSARLNMFRHLHEVKSGRTSSLSHEILGFDAQGNVVNYGCSELMTAERIGERSAKLVSFLDLAGHSKYQRTTLHGLTGYCPHYAMVVISATAGVTRITEEHIGLLLALDMPFFTVITKCELSPATDHVRKLHHILHAYGKKPLLITDENMARNCVAPNKLILDLIDGKQNNEEERPQMEQIPVFPVSCVRGFGLNSLHAYLLELQTPAVDAQLKGEDETCEFQIDEVFHTDDCSGPVVGGLLAKGQMYEGDQLIMGPMESGKFIPVRIMSIYRNRACVTGARAGNCVSVCLRSEHKPRPGMVLLHPPEGGAGIACERGDCATRRLNELVKNKNTDNKKSKTSKLKNKNLIQDAKESLSKSIDNLKENIYEGRHSQNTFRTVQTVKDGNKNDLTDCQNVFDKNDNGYRIEKDKMEDFDSEQDGCSSDDCICENVRRSEDGPRGCIYFQATVRLLRHSTAICPGFQCTVHVGNVRQTAIIEGILSRGSILRAGESAAVVFRFVRFPEYLVSGRRLLFTAGLGTKAIGRVTQTFPFKP